MTPDYDAKQIGAPLRQCAVCWRFYYMTRPAAVCLRCTEEAARDAKR